MGVGKNPIIGQSQVFILVLLSSDVGWMWNLDEGIG